MNVLKEDDTHSWFTRLKHFLHLEPQNIEDLVDLLRDAETRKLIDFDTLTMIEGVIILAQMRVRDVMLPKKQMHCIHKNESLNDIIHMVSESGHSRFPIMDEGYDQIIGILHAKDLLRFQSKTKNAFNLQDIMREAMFVPESKRLDLLLRDFRVNRNHMAIVVDEYGATAGFVTLEDIMEQIIGDIEDEFDVDEETSIKKHADHHYIIKGDTTIASFNEQLHTNFGDENYDTMGGIIMAQFGYLPKNGESITIERLQFDIIKADARRIKLMACLDRRQNS